MGSDLVPPLCIGTIKEIIQSGRMSSFSRIKLNSFKINLGQISTRQDSISLLILSIPTDFPDLRIPETFFSSSSEILLSSGPRSVHLGGNSVGFFVLRRDEFYTPII